jgi:restriction system protein
VARRKRRRATSGDAAGLVLLIVAVAVVGFVFLIISAIAHNVVLLLLVLGGGIGLIAWRGNARYKRWQALQDQQAQLRAQQVGWEVRRQYEEAQAAEQARKEAAVFAARAAAIDSYYSMTAREFEQAIAWLCQRDGCVNVRVTGGAGDLGADVRAILPERRVLIIQCKRYASGNFVTGPDLQRFGGTCFAVHKADVAAVVTTSDFTKQARTLAATLGIVLFDFDALGGWVAQNGPPPWGTVEAGPQGRHSRPAS